MRKVPSVNRNIHCADPEWGTKGPNPPTPEKSKNIEYLSRTDQDPLKITKLPSQHSMLGHHPHARETPLNGVSLVGR